MRAGLALLANHVDRNRLVLHALLLIVLGLLQNLAGNEDLLHDAPGRRRDVVENDTNGRAPAEPHHHDGHDDAHGLRHGSLLGIGLHVVEQHGNERQHAKGDVKEDVGPRRCPPERRHGRGGGVGKGGEHAVEVRTLGDLVL